MEHQSLAHLKELYVLLVSFLMNSNLTILNKGLYKKKIKILHESIIFDIHLFVINTQNFVYTSHVVMHSMSPFVKKFNVMNYHKFFCATSKVHMES